MVDSHLETLQEVALFLVSLGHWVETCTDARTALERMNYDGLDVLLTDVWLPDASDWSYLGELQKRGTMPPRVISMSTADEPTERLQSRAAGCYAHLVKPLKATELEAALL